jgi:DNA-directed RNA polymerase subunit M/transcription elongation factor TFIIS
MEMGADDLASDARKEDNQKIREHATWEAERGQKGQGTTDQFQCAKCRQRKCTYYVRGHLPCFSLTKRSDCAAVRVFEVTC